MSVEDTIGIVDLFTARLGIKIFLLLFLVFYAVFAIVLYTQIKQMGHKLPTSVNPFFKFIGLLNIGLALAILFITIGIF